MLKMFREERELHIIRFNRDKNVTPETCCLLERLRNTKDHITVTLDMEDYYRIKDAEKNISSN